MGSLAIALGENANRVDVIRLARTMSRLKVYDHRRRVAIMRCTHRDWTFKTQGRCCFGCGAWMVDFGD